jgi:quercetin dioxygenase-like cupin family protein
MAEKQKVVFKITDVPLIESPDGRERDSVMVTDDTCGAKQFSAGLFFVRPGTKCHEGQHAGQEELYYIFQGKGKVMIDGVAHEVAAGDVVFIPDGCVHFPWNDGDETLGLFWVIPDRWSDMPELDEVLSTWTEVPVDSNWRPLA